MITINKKTKKILAAIMLVITIISSLPISAFAAYITDINSDAQFGVVSGSLASYGHELHYANYSGSTYLLFCAQYGQTSPGGGTYAFDSQFKAELNRGVYQKAAQYIYFGYTMKHGTGLPTTAEAKRDACATQQYLWEYVRDNVTSSFGTPSRDSWNSSYMSSSIYSSWLSETERTYNNYYNTNVSFNGQTIKLNIGESKTITDTNGVLANYESFEKTSNGITFKHTQGSNDVTVTSNGGNTDSATFRSSDYAMYRLMPNGAKYSKNEMSSYVYFKFTTGSIQDMIFSSYVDPTYFRFDVEVESGKIALKKTDTNGTAVAGCVFKLYSDSACTQEVSTGTSKSDGSITFDKLVPGTYYIKEVQVPKGYLIDNSVKKVELQNGDTKEVEFKNNEPVGELKIYKINENKDKLDGAEFTITAAENIKNVSGSKTYYTKGQVVATVITKNGVASKDNLPIGKYLVNETKAPEGYVLNEETFNANIEYKDDKTSVVSLEIKGIENKEPHGTITLVKKDSKTGSKAQGDATLEGAVYKLYANEDIYNVARTKKYYSKGDEVATRTTAKDGSMQDITDLPLGKYILKEETAPKGYLMDKNSYEVTLKYKDQKTKVVTESVVSQDDVKKMQVHIFKSGIKGESGLVKGIQGAEFTIKLLSDVEKAKEAGYTYAEIWSGINEDGNKVDVDSNRASKAQLIAPTYQTIQTDENGNAYSKELPYGKYIAKETITPQDFYTAADFTFTISEDTTEAKTIFQKIKHFVVNDGQTESYIKLVKKDKTTGKIVTLSSATFQIKASEDIYDRGNGKIVWKKGEVITQKVGSTVYDSFTTNSKNLVVPLGSYINDKDELGTTVTPLMVQVGSYEISEIGIPGGFLKLESPIKFTIEKIKDYDTDITGDYVKTITIENEQPTGTLIVDKSVALREDVDTSLVDISDLSAIQFKLVAKSDITDKADGSVIYKANQEIGTYNLTKEGKLEVSKLPMGEYELAEIKTIAGLALNNTKYEVKFEKKDDTTKVYTETRKVVNDTTVVEFSKTDITGQEELEGAKLTILDGNNVIDSWTSGKETHKIEGLIAGKEYILREEIAPEGFAKSTDIKFKVDDTNKIQKVVMVDKVVEMSKQDIGGKELEGAKMQVFDKNNNLVDEWTSGKEPHKIKGLTEGETYRLHEEVAIEGYVKATDAEFKVTEDKNTQKVVMVDKIVEITKTDLTTGEELEGAELIVTDKDGNEVDRWVSGKEPHHVTGLEEGETYTLTEITCPYGYEQAESIEFTVTTEKETQKVEMKDMPILKNVKVIKADSSTKENIYARFVFAIYEDKECTKLIERVESNKEDASVLFENLRYNTYYVKEEIAPTGYKLSDKVVEIKINDEGVFADGENLEEKEDVYSFVFYDDLIPEVHTGNEISNIIWISLIVLAVIGTTSGIIILKKRNRIDD